MWRYWSRAPKSWSGMEIDQYSHVIYTDSPHTIDREYINLSDLIQSFSCLAEMEEFLFLLDSKINPVANKPYL
jgi:hypothetical protein